MDWPNAFVTAVGIVAGTAGATVTIRGLGASKENVKALSPEDATAIRASLNSLMSSFTQAQMDSIGLKKDVEHIAEKIERLEEQRERDHKEMKKISQILYPLLKNEIAKERKAMGLDTDTGEMSPAT